MTRSNPSSIPAPSRRTFNLVVLSAAASVGLPRLSWAVEPYGPADASLTIAVLDPLAAPLSCDCVEGYAQRKYEALADRLQRHLGRTARVVWAESLEAAKRQTGEAPIDLVIGKESVVRTDAQTAKLKLSPVAHLTDRDGDTQHKGLFVVRRENDAATLLDLEGYEMLYGSTDSDEKSSAPRQLLEELEIGVEEGDVCVACSSAVKRLMEQPADAKVAAVISSHSLPLLVGCGTVRKGDLKVVGESEPVPFIAAFLREGADAAVGKTLLSLRDDDLLKSLESARGFVPYRV